MKKIKKKLVFYIMVLTCILIITPNLKAATLTVGSNSGLPGDKNILIPLNLTSAPSEESCSFNFDLNFDISRLAFKTVALGPKAIEAGKSLSHSQPNPNIVRVIVIGFNQNVIGNGVVLNFTFDILRNTPNGKTKLSISKASISDTNGKPLAVNISGGALEVLR